ncbi:MAG: 2-amino-4-hydroxy-6-hydroxymethyldihydropteridine diphosphokinase [bacterium]|nr:2-amino-4-hydroxy-6-hydroxymethyldihydropteridine diphosphokinase [bacterium]
MAICYISLGSNVGNKKKNIERALELIKDIDKVEISKVSSLYHTEPVGVKDQDWFLNCCAEIEVSLSPKGLLSALQDIENRLGREEGIRWGPRIIDIDILLYDALEISSKDLKIPHPYLDKRRFVLIPLREIAEKIKHPTLNLTIKELLNNLDDVSIVEKI